MILRPTSPWRYAPGATPSMPATMQKGFENIEGMGARAKV